MQLKIFDPAAVRASAGNVDLIGDAVSIYPADSAEGRRERLLADMAADDRGGKRDVLVANNTTVRRIQQVRTDCPNFSTPVELALRAATVSSKTRTNFKLPPILLLGQPGTGKTRFARKLAQALDTPVVEQSMVGADDTVLTGHSVSWRGARAGLVAKTLIQGSSASPIILLDEIDKPQIVGHADLLDPLHALLEPENARAFVDTFLEVPVRADKILWIATANEISHLKPSILDRFLIMRIDAPDRSQQRAIVESVYDQVVRAYNAHFNPELSPDVVTSLVEESPRRIRMILDLAIGFAAIEHRDTISRSDIDSARTVAGDTTQRRRIGFLADQF